MEWGLLAVLTAFFESAKDVLGKRNFGGHDPVVLAWAWRFFALPFLVPFLLITGIPELGPDFLWALLVGGGLNVVSSILYMSALRASDLSLTVPLVAFTPLFLLVTSPVLLGEYPGPLGVIGVLLIVAGSYLMKAEGRQGGFLSPFRALLREPGARRMLLVSLIWSITANVDKIGLKSSSPAFWALAVNLFIAVALFPAAWRHRNSAPLATGASLGALVSLGAAGGLTTICQMSAITRTLVPYVIAVKRTSIVMSVLWGHFFFSEEGLRERLGGALLMLSGMLLILLR